MKRSYYIWILLTGLLLAVSCGKEPSGEDNGESTGKTVNFSPDRTRILRNPLSGWVLYSGLGDGLSDNFWRAYDNLQLSNGTTVKVSDYASVLFIKGAWSDMNPEEGVYIWNDGVNTKPAQRLRMLIEGAEERGLKLAFTFSVDSRDKHYNITPDYVRNKPGIEGFVSTTGSVQVWSPYPDNKVFQECYRTFLAEFAKKFNDPAKVAFISGWGLGKWGESHTVKYSTELTLGANDISPREETMEWFGNTYATLFDKVPVFINYHRWIGTNTEFNGSNYDPDSERLIQKAIDQGFSLRHDAFGMKTYYSNWERNFIAARRYTRPVIMEGGWVASSHGGSIGGDGYSSYADVRHGEYNEGKGAYVNMMDLRYTSQSPVDADKVTTGETYSWFNDAFDLVEEFLREGCYRLYPDRIQIPEEVGSDRKVQITHRWRNLGWSYCPTNIPQYKGRFHVKFALLRASTLDVVYAFEDKAADPSKWYSSSPVTCKFSPDLSKVAAGDYVWAVAITDDVLGNNVPGIELSVPKSKLADNGWLKICNVSFK